MGTNVTLEKKIEYWRVLGEQLKISDELSREDVLNDMRSFLTNPDNEDFRTWRKAHSFACLHEI